jgi:hypothetical protein
VQIRIDDAIIGSFRRHCRCSYPMRDCDSRDLDDLVKLFVRSGSIHENEDVVRPYRSLGETSNAPDSFSHDEYKIRVEEVGIAWRVKDFSSH